MSVFLDSYDALEAKCQTALEALDAGHVVAPYQTEFVPLPKLLQEEGASRKVKALGFSRTLAKKVRVIPALILRYIAFKVYSVRHQRNGKLWYYATYREIAKQYSFLNPSTINRAISSLVEAKLLITGNYNRRKGDKTRWFSVSEEARNQCDADLIYFDPCDANAVGIKAAIVWYHLQYTLRNKPELLKNGVWLKVWPSDLAAYQPLSKLEAHNALTKLVKIGYLVKDDVAPYSSCYRLGEFGGVIGALDSESDPIGFGARPL